MVSVSNILYSLSEPVIAQQFRPHDEVRMRYRLTSNRINSWEEFKAVTGDYYNVHYTSCNTRGGTFTRSQASSRVKHLMIEFYQHKNKNLPLAFWEASTGAGKGLGGVLDDIAQALKEQ